MAIASGGPVLYGEGAVAHAGLLIASGLDPYASETPGTFVAANYPPFAFVIVALGSPLGPFIGLRAASVIATIALAAAIVWRARRFPLAGVALAASFVALFPVQQWGPAHKPDPLATALTAFAVLLAGPSSRAAAGSGILGALAIFAKPTAALPLAVVYAYLALRDFRSSGERRTGGGLVSAYRAPTVLVLCLITLGLLSAAAFDSRGMFEHIVMRNALPYHTSSAAALLVVGALTCGAFAVLALWKSQGRMRAYVLGALGVALLAGREGATVNYLLDLAAASCLTLAGVSSAGAAEPAKNERGAKRAANERSGRSRNRPAVTPLLLAGQLVLGTFLLISGALGGTGSWADPRRAQLVSDLARTAPHLAEDSGLLVANGIAPEVDDLFLWSRLVQTGALADELTPRVRNGAFATVIAEARLDELSSAPAYERQRWPDDLVREVLAVYRLETALPGHYRYVPRRGVAME